MLFYTLRKINKVYTNSISMIFIVRYTATGYSGSLIAIYMYFDFELFSRTGKTTNRHYVMFNVNTVKIVV